MRMTFEIVGILVLTYLVGSIPFGYLIGRLKGIDIRQHGSGNIGATNVLRTLGKPFGIPCFFLDFMKGLIPVIVVTQTFPENRWAPLAAVFGTVLGHVYTLYLKFKGGKGVATTAGAMCGLAWPLVLCGLIGWFVILKLSGYVSLASMLAGVFVSLLVWIDPLNAGYPQITKILFTVMAALVILRHRTNIGRLIRGEESSFKKKKK